MRLKPSGSSEWKTPAWMIELFRYRYPFTLDAFASKKNTICKQFRSKNKGNRFEDMSEEEANKHTFVWANPPYGVDDIEKAVDKTVRLIESRKLFKRLVICLLVPAKTDQAWWLKAFRAAAFVFFVRGRMHFSKSEQGAQQSHVVFVFDSDVTRRNGPNIHGILQPDSRAKKQASFY